MQYARGVSDEDVLDEETSEALLSGIFDTAVDPSSTNAGLSRLLDELRALDLSVPSGGEAAMRELYRNEFGGTLGTAEPAPISLDGQRSAHRMARRAAALGAVLALGTSGVAAASGSLPAPLQQRAHETLAVIGISIPAGHADDSGQRDQERGPGSSGAVVTPANQGSSRGNDAADEAANREPASGRGDGPGVTDGNGDRPGGTIDPNVGGPATPGGAGNPATPNPGGPATPGGAGSPATPNPGGPATPGGAGNPATPNPGGPATPNPGAQANQNPGGVTDSGP